MFHTLLTCFSSQGLEGGWGGAGLLPTVLALITYGSHSLKNAVPTCSRCSSQWLGGPGTRVLPYDSSASLELSLRRYPLPLHICVQAWKDSNKECGARRHSNPSRGKT